MLIEVEFGDVVEFGFGCFEFDMMFFFDVVDVMICGVGFDEMIIDFLN